MSAREVLAVIGLTDAQGVVTARRLAREAATELGLEEQDRTRVATAISELAREAHERGGGQVLLALGLPERLELVCEVSDSGPPTAEPDLAGVGRLMDRLAVRAGPRGRVVEVAKRLGAPAEVDLGQLRAQLGRRTAADAQAELEQQNRELLRALHELQRHQDELRTLNLELDETNRGVVALHAELLEAQQRDHRTSQVIQRSLLPPRLADAPGVRVVARHRSAGEGALVGGDFYDSVLVSPQELWLVMGDVAGHGVETAAKASELRQGLRLLAREGYGPERAVERLNRLVLDDEQTSLATVCVVRLALGEDRADLVVAGHPPPLAVAPDGGSARLLEGARGPVLGVEGTTWEACPHPLTPGEWLVLYTDGLVERPGEVLDLGLERLLERARGLSADPAVAVDELFGLLPASSTLRDDVAVVLAART